MPSKNRVYAVRPPAEMSTEIDDAVAQRKTNRHAWMIEAFRNQLKRDKKRASK